MPSCRLYTDTLLSMLVCCVTFRLVFKLQISNIKDNCSLLCRKETKVNTNFLNFKLTLSLCLCTSTITFSPTTVHVAQGPHNITTLCHADKCTCTLKFDHNYILETIMSIISASTQLSLDSLMLILSIKYELSGP